MKSNPVNCHSFHLPFGRVCFIWWPLLKWNHGNVSKSTVMKRASCDQYSIVIRSLMSKFCNEPTICVDRILQYIWILTGMYTCIYSSYYFTGNPNITYFKFHCINVNFFEANSAPHNTIYHFICFKNYIFNYIATVYISWWRCMPNVQFIMQFLMYVAP